MWCQRREWSDWPCRTAFYAAWSHWKWCLKAENQFLESKALVSAAIYWVFEITRINVATKGQSLYQDKVLHSRENTLRFALPELPKCPTLRSCKSLRNWEICINIRKLHGFECATTKYRNWTGDSPVKLIPVGTKSVPGSCFMCIKSTWNKLIF